jgi:hypothetical protein
MLGCKVFQGTLQAKTKLKNQKLKKKQAKQSQKHQ